MNTPQEQPRVALVDRPCAPRSWPLPPARAGRSSRTPLLVYTALETDAMKLYKDGFEKAEPGYRE